VNKPPEMIVGEHVGVGPLLPVRVEPVLPQLRVLGHAPRDLGQLVRADRLPRGRKGRSLMAPDYPQTAKNWRGSSSGAATSIGHVERPRDPRPSRVHRAGRVDSRVSRTQLQPGPFRRRAGVADPHTAAAPHRDGPASCCFPSRERVEAVAAGNFGEKEPTGRGMRTRSAHGLDAPALPPAAEPPPARP
jgi:hypothetical protein